MDGGLTGGKEVGGVDLQGAFFVEACHGGQVRLSRFYCVCMRGIDLIKEGASLTLESIL